MHGSLYRPGSTCVNPMWVRVCMCAFEDGCVSELFVREGVDPWCGSMRHTGSGAPSHVEVVHPARVRTQLWTQDTSPWILPRHHAGPPLGRAGGAEEILGDGRWGAEQNPERHPGLDLDFSGANCTCVCARTRLCVHMCRCEALGVGGP